MKLLVSRTPTRGGTLEPVSDDWEDECKSFTKCLQNPTMVQVLWGHRHMSRNNKSFFAFLEVLPLLLTQTNKVKVEIPCYIRVFL